MISLQYRQPAYAAWLRYGRQLEDTAKTRISQHWTDDDVTFYLLEGNILSLYLDRPPSPAGDQLGGGL